MGSISNWKMLGIRGSIEKSPKKLPEQMQYNINKMYSTLHCYCQDPNPGEDWCSTKT